LVVEDVEPDVARNADGHLAAAAQRLHLDSPEGRERARFGGAHPAGALAMRADVGGAIQDATAAALAADLHQAEGRDLAHLHARAVVAQAILQLLLDGAVVLRLV